MADNWPDATLAPDGAAPRAFIMHHTAGRGDPASVVNFWRQQGKGYGAQYIMDRQGVVHDVRKEFGYGGTNEILNGTGPGQGLSNSNVVGMEIVANNDADVTPQQAQAAAQFIAARYPNTQLFGHGQINAGHKEATEGLTAVNAAMALRGRGLPAGYASASTAGPVANIGVTNPFMRSLEQIESGGQNIYSKVDKDYPGQPNSRSQGFFQIDTPTWAQFAGPSKYSNAMSAPLDEQGRVASLIPISRFGQRTRDMLHQQYGAFDDSATVGQLAARFGGGTTLNSTPSTQTSTTGTVSPPTATPGSVNGPPGMVSGTQPPGAMLPGFTSQKASDKVKGGVEGLGQALGYGGGGGQTPQMPQVRFPDPSQFRPRMGPGALTAGTPNYGTASQQLAAIAGVPSLGQGPRPLQFNGAVNAPSPYGGAGMAQSPAAQQGLAQLGMLNLYSTSPWYGTSMSSMPMDPYVSAGGYGGFGGGMF